MRTLLYRAVRNDVVAGVEILCTTNDHWSIENWNGARVNDCRIKRVAPILRKYRGVDEADDAPERVLARLVLAGFTVQLISEEKR